MTQIGSLTGHSPCMDRVRTTVPLPFLTADRAFDTTDDVALPYDDRDRWRRPYRPAPWRVGAAAVLLLLASFVLFSSVITNDSFIGHRPSESTTSPSGPWT